MVVQVLWSLDVPFETLNALAYQALQQWLTSPQLYIDFRVLQRV